MTEPLDTAAAGIVSVLDAIDDPIERYQASRDAETAVADGIKGVRQRIAIQLKSEHGKTWREIGEIMGKVTAQRAHQIAAGK